MQLFSRLKLALTEEHPSAPEFDQNQWVDELKFTYRNFYTITRFLNQRVVAIGENVSNSDLERKVNLEGTGDLTVAFLLAKLSWHERHHLEHIKIALSN